MMFWHDGMLRDLVWHTSLIEIVWLALAAAGIVLATLNGLEALRDFQSLNGKTNGRRTIAVGNLRREVVRGMIHTAFFLIGLLAAATPARPSDGFPVIAVVLVLASAGMVVNSYLDRRDRLYLLQNGLQPRDSQGRFTSE
jgi:glycerol uptake facilitator-like aquaporin